MHGIVLRQLKEFLVTKGQSTTWMEIAHRRGWDNPLNPSIHKAYGHDEFDGILDVATELLGTDRETLIQNFGVHMAGFFSQAYRHMMRPEWSFEDLLLNTEVFMHGEIRFAAVGAKPPILEMVRPSADTIELDYRSPLHLCSMAKGIILGFAAQFNRAVVLSESSCMLHGDSVCHITIHL